MTKKYRISAVYRVLYSFEVSKTRQIRLGVSFNEYYIGDNLHSFYAKDNDLSKINKKLAGQAVGAVTSYRNLLFHVQVSQEDEAKNVLDDTLTAISKEIIKYFN